MKVLVADKFPDIYIQQMKDKKLEVIYQPKLGENDLPEVAKDVDIIIVRSTVVNERTIKDAQNLKLIIRAGSGVNNIDTKAATAKKVYVANCPGKNSIAVAELAIGLMVALDRRIPHNVIDFKNNIWNKAEYSKADGLFGKTFGVIGTGNIGREVAKRAKAFGMKVIGYDLAQTPDTGIEYKQSVEDVVKNSDVISVHLPSNSETKGMFNEKMFDLMKKGTIFINTSRHQVINEDDLIKAVQEKGIKVGIDVFADEPERKDGTVSSKLQNISNVYVTHHIGASTEQAQNAVAEETVRIITEYVEKNNVINAVNKF
ncbi:MAG: phosphoglycerate dehydrogenase [Ignavibacteriales bacterium]|nr:phosphoglycerate dehydrogenase [Ignavibacteriales bacterium]